MTKLNLGIQMHDWAKELFPICRSLTGPGVRSTLNFIKSLIPDLEIFAVPSGTKVFDWTIPDEWVIRKAFIKDELGNIIIDFNQNNLHVVGYSEPVDLWIDLEELNKNLHSLPDQPDAIPYVTSYYTKRWGFCLTHNQRESLKPGKYRVVIDADLKPGQMNYAHLLIPGDDKKEVLLSTYICHPSMANNELSGPVVSIALAQWLISLENRRYSYRIVFIPETIGSITYISRHLEHLQSNVIAGFNITCVGDDRCYSLLPSRAGNTLSDLAARHALHYIEPNFVNYTWLDRGSDERQYCAPGIDLPIASIMRTKYGKYPEYHTSLDDLSLVTASGLEGGFKALQSAILVIEQNLVPKINVKCEPQLGRRGLYPSLSTKESSTQVSTMMNLISYCDGRNSLLEIAEIIGEPIGKLFEIIKLLIDEGIVEI
jgi:aminopeptidase-like protein